MTKFFGFLLAGAMLVGAGQTAIAGTTGNGMMTKPTCAAGDPVVGVNMNTKMYMTHDQMKKKMAGMTHDQMHAAMQKNHVQLMCKSKADAMGAKMMTGSM